MQALLNLPGEALNRQLAFGVWSDFDEFVTGDKFTDTSGDSGAAVNNIDAVGGQVQITSIAIDNNEAYLHTTKELFLFANNKPILAVCRLAFAQANTDDINVAFGLMDGVGADSIVDNGGGPKSSYSGAVFFTADGGTLWNTEVSLATTQATTQLTAANSLDKSAKVAASGATTFQELAIECIPYSTTNQKVNFFINGVHVSHYDMVYTSATEMDLFVGLKLGGATIETVTVDYLGAWQKR